MKSKWQNYVLGCFILGLILTACAPAASDPAPTAPESTAVTSATPVEEASAEPTVLEAVASEPIEIDLAAVPIVDIAQHSVPLEEIYFDTFQSVNRTVPLSQAKEDLIARLRDVIPPIYTPKFEPASEAEIWLSETDLVIGYADGEAAFAYPIKILNWHEMVSHEVNGRPILATY